MFPSCFALVVYSRMDSYGTKFGQLKTMVLGLRGGALLQVLWGRKEADTLRNDKTRDEERA